MDEETERRRFRVQVLESYAPPRLPRQWITHTMEDTYVAALREQHRLMRATPGARVRIVTEDEETVYLEDLTPEELG